MQGHNSVACRCIWALLKNKKTFVQFGWEAPVLTPLDMLF